MKKFLLMLALCTSLQAAEEPLMLKDVEVFSSEFSTQAILFFSGQCNPIQKVSSTDARLTLFFPTMQLGDINKELVFNKLNKFGLVEKLRIDNVKETVNGKLVHGVLLDVKFQNDKAFVKLVQLNERNKFVMEVYSKKELERLGKAIDGPLKLAQLASKKKMVLRYV